MGLKTTVDFLVVGPLTATDNAVPRFDGATGKLIQDSGITITDAGVLTGDGSGLTGVSGGGDVVGPASSVDNRLVRWDGVTGKLIQDNGSITVSDSGIILGCTAFTVDSLFLDLNQITTPVDVDLWLTTTGTGGLNFNGVTVDPSSNVAAISNLDMTGDLTADGSVLIKGGGPQISFTNDDAKGFLEWRTTGGVRTGWIGKGTGANEDISIRNEATLSAANINFHPEDGDGTGKVTIVGFSQLGSASSSVPEIKMKKLTGTTGATEGSRVTVAHGLTGAKILAIDCLILWATNSKMGPGHIYDVGYNYSCYADNININVRLDATGSENVTSKAFTVLITYEA